MFRFLSFHIKADHLSLLVCCHLVLDLRGPFTNLMPVFWHVKTEILVFILDNLCLFLFLEVVLWNLLQEGRRALTKMLFKFGIRITLDSCWKCLKSGQKLVFWPPLNLRAVVLGACDGITDCRVTVLSDASLSLEKRRLKHVPAHTAAWGWAAAGLGLEPKSVVVLDIAQHTALPALCLPSPHCLVSASSKPFSFSSFLSRVSSSPSWSWTEGLAEDGLGLTPDLPTSWIRGLQWCTSVPTLSHFLQLFSLWLCLWQGT